MLLSACGVVLVLWRIKVILAGVAQVRLGLAVLGALDLWLVGLWAFMVYLRPCHADWPCAWTGGLGVFPSYCHASLQVYVFRVLYRVSCFYLMQLLCAARLVICITLPTHNKDPGLTDCRTPTEYRQLGPLWSGLRLIGLLFAQLASVAALLVVQRRVTGDCILACLCVTVCQGHACVVPAHVSRAALLQVFSVGMLNVSKAVLCCYNSSRSIKYTYGAWPWW